MRKLVDAEKKLSNILKRELKTKDEIHDKELSAKIEVQSRNLELSQKVVDTKEIIDRLQDEINVIKKKSYERKIKLKYAQQAHKANLSEYIQKYENTMNRIKEMEIAKLEKKKKKKKTSSVKSLKLVFGEKLSKQSLSKHVDDTFSVKQFDKNTHTKVYENTLIGFGDKTDDDRASQETDFTIEPESNIKNITKDISATDKEIERDCTDAIKELDTLYEVNENDNE